MLDEQWNSPSADQVHSFASAGALLEDREDAVTRVMLQLTDDEQELLVHRLAGFHLHEIAVRLNVSPCSVYLRMKCLSDRVKAILSVQ